MTLPLALAPMQQYRQFICWTLRDGVKLPINPKTGEVCNAHAPEVWESYDYARNAVGMFSASGVAFVLTEQDPFWFVDIDKCLLPDGSGWSQVANTICAMLPGAAIEVSQSGRGLHLFGTGAVPEHACKNTALGIEFYHKERFVALTGTNAIGYAATDLTQSLPAFVQTYFNPADAAGAVDTENWQDEADPAYTGPFDDTELLQKAFAARTSIGSVLRGKATFTDLWMCQRDVLAATYPPNDSSKQWDYSSADAALAQHLAFWTGRNTERMKRLMFMSGLVREKWTKHRSYMWRTIARACKIQKDIYQHVPRRAEAQRTVALASVKPTMRTGFQYMTAQQQLEYFDGCIYVLDEHSVYTPRGAFMDQGQFNVKYGGYVFSLDSENEKTTRKAWEVFTESQVVDFPKVDSTCFRPELPPGAIIEEESHALVNTYFPIHTKRQAGDPSRFLNHLRKLLPVERDRLILLSYMAAVVQNPGFKMQWCPVIQGAEGNGKTVFINVLTEAVGKRYTHLPNANELVSSGGKFNAWIQRRLFIGVEEIHTYERQDVLDMLKPLITNARIEIQAKGANQITGDNRANFLMLTNFRDAIPADVDKRRYCIMFTAQQNLADINESGLTETYFKSFYDWLKAEGYAIITEYLHSFKPLAEFDPTGICVRAPKSSTFNAAVKAGYGRIEQEIIEASEASRPGFSGGWVASTALEKLLKDLNAANRISHEKRKEILKKLGYELHPGLDNGRPNVPVPGETGKPQLYIKPDTAGYHARDHRTIIHQYMLAQGMLK